MLPRATQRPLGCVYASSQGLRGIWGADKVAALQRGDMVVPGLATGEDGDKLTLIEAIALYRKEGESSSEDGAGPLVIDGEVRDADDEPTGARNRC